MIENIPITRRGIVKEVGEKCRCDIPRKQYRATYEYCKKCGWNLILIYEGKKIVGIVPLELPDRKSLLLHG